MKNRFGKWKRSLRLLTYIAICAISFGFDVGRHKYLIKHYDEYDGLSQRYITSIVQGDDGFIWIGTWNGIDRYDGHEFVNFKSCHDDCCRLPSDRIVSMVKGLKGNLYCLIDQHIFVFDTHTYHYSEMPNGRMKLQAKKRFDEILHTQDRNPWRSVGEGVFYQTTDESGCLWLRSNFGMYKLTPAFRQYTSWPQERQSQVRCFFRDRKRRLWVANKEDKTVRIYDGEDSLLGYLLPNGSMSHYYASFGSAVYCICQDEAGRILLGCKPEGLYVLTERQREMSFGIEHHTAEKEDKFSLSNNEIYDIKEDSKGRLWIATFQGGLNCVYRDHGHVRFANKNNLLRLPTGYGNKVRNISILPNGVLVAATTEGLLVADINHDNLRDIKFRLHEKELKRESSLSNNATMFTLAGHDGNLYVCTESGGLNVTPIKSLLDATLRFTHLDTYSGFPTDITLSVIENGKMLWVVSNSGIIRYNTVDGTSTQFDTSFFRSNFRFSDAVPIRLASGRWLFGLQDGAITLNLDSLSKSEYKPDIIVTGVSIKNSPVDYTIGNKDTIRLAPNERNLTVHFSATDYNEPEDIKFAFRINRGEWNHIGHNRSATLFELAAGVYTIEIKSTNSDGVWVNNTRKITVVVSPKWYETTLAKFFYVLLTVVLVSLSVHVAKYIRRIKHQKEKLEAYLHLAMLSGDNHENENKQTVEDEILEKAQIMATDDIFMKKVLQYVETHISDTDINIQSMAEAVAVSRAGLNRKMKTLLGIAPIAFVREVRIQKACKMLGEGDATVNDVSMACGFSDQRYFSKCFKDKYGMTPSEYRSKNS